MWDKCGIEVDKSTNFIHNSQSNKPLSERFLHQLEECNRNGRWSRVAQSLLIPNFCRKSLLLYAYLFIDFFLLLFILATCLIVIEMYYLLELNLCTST